MSREDKSLEKTIETLHDLSRLLHLSQDAATRLKKDIPSGNFPVAYKLSKMLKVLQEAVDELQSHLDPAVSQFPRQEAIKDLISSSDRL